MRIGVYFGRKISVDLKAGGASTFQQSILNVLLGLKESEHEIFIFSDDIFDSKIGEIKFVQLNRYYANQNENIFKKLFLKIPRKLKRLKLEKKYFTALNKACLDNNIELMWFVTPAYEYVTVPYIYTVWDLQHRLQSYFPEVSVAGWKFEDREKRYNVVIPRAAYVITGNQAGKNEIVNFYGIPKQRIKTLPLPTPDFVLNQTEKQNNLLEKYKLPKHYLFYPAQFWPHKNHIVILLALNILKEKYNLDFSVIFTGSDKGNLKYIKEKTKKLGLEKKVYFLGFVSTEELVQLYKNAFALVFPSFFGPDNIPPLEAFVLNCPVITAQVSGSEYQLAGAVMLFDTKNEQDLADKIKKLYDNPNLKADFIRKGEEKALNWTAENYLQGVLKIIDEFEPIRRCWSSEKVYKES